MKSTCALPFAGNITNKWICSSSTQTVDALVQVHHDGDATTSEQQRHCAKSVGESQLAPSRRGCILFLVIRYIFYLHSMLQRSRTNKWRSYLRSILDGVNERNALFTWQTFCSYHSEVASQRLSTEQYVMRSCCTMRPRACETASDNVQEHVRT